jgi:hypothetical protein
LSGPDKIDRLLVETERRFGRTEVGYHEKSYVFNRFQLTDFCWAKQKLIGL